MSLVHLVYVSSATRQFSQAELIALLATSCRNNEPVGITGMLLYRDGNFMQVLEGEESAVAAAYDRISKDRRHDGLITMLKEPIATRDFGDWSMGFRDLNSIEVHNAPGY